MRAVCAYASVEKPSPPRIDLPAHAQPSCRVSPAVAALRAPASRTPSTQRGGPPISRSPGEALLTAASSACNAALNGNTNESAPITSYSPCDTDAEGTSARNASGSDSTNASSEAARTSRASAPIAMPSAPNPMAPDASAITHKPARDQSRLTNAPIPASIARASTNAQPAASTSFSTSSPSRVSRPRTRRASVWSSRSRATPPAASSTHTNISDTLTATTTANVFNGVRRPWIACCGSGSAGRSWTVRSWKAEVRSANSANSSTRSAAVRSVPGGRRAIIAAQLGRDLAAGRSGSLARRAHRGCRR